MEGNKVLFLIQQGLGLNGLLLTGAYVLYFFTIKLQSSVTGELLRDGAILLTGEP